jgi:hypothetical protein
MNNIYKLITICLLFFVSCNEDQFLSEAPLDAIYAENLYQTLTGFDLGMNAVYAQMRLHKADDNKLKLWVQQTDQAASGGDDNKFISYNSSESSLSENYDWLYKVINSVNMIINRAEGDVDWEGTSNEVNLANKNMIISRALVVRAWAYRLLIYAFGPVPLSAEEITGATYSNAWERNSIEEIKAQMKEDLEFAAENLSLSYSDNSKINGAVARHYLGELYLSLGEFQNAVDVLKPLCESGDYILVQSRFGRLASDADGNHFLDVIRSPYTYQGNTETMFTFSNALDLPGSDAIKLHAATMGDFGRIKRISSAKPKKLKNDVEFIEHFGGKGQGRTMPTPYAILDKTFYELYEKYRFEPSTTDDENVIDKWLWTNDDGRDNYLFELEDIRGQETSIRKSYTYDLNGDGVIDPPSVSLEEAIASHSEQTINKYATGDIIDLAFTYALNDDGFLNMKKSWTSLYSRKWVVDATLTNNWLDANTAFHAVGYLRLAESYLLYAEALFMNGSAGDAATWLNKVRERSGASTIESGDVSIEFILDERTRELLTEEDRRVTLLRTGTYIARVTKYNPSSKYYVEDKHTMYPFPLEAILANKDNLLDQNVGYGGSTTVDFTPPGYPDEGL